MKIFTKTLFFLILLWPIQLFAETEPYVELICNQNKSLITIKYDREWKGSGTRYQHLISASKENPPSAWRLRTLRNIGQKQENGKWKAWIESSDVITQKCEINNDKYEVIFGVINGNPGNLYGMCGGWFSGWVKIIYDDQIVFETKFEEDCFADELITEIQYFGIRGKAPKIEMSSLKEYYDY